MPKEIGIIILADDEANEIAETLRAQVLEKLDIYFEDPSEQEIYKKETNDNQLHFSLFQMVVEDEEITNLETAVAELAQQAPELNFMMKTTLADTQENIFWDAEKPAKDSEIAKFHARVVDTANRFRAKDREFSQIENMSPEEKANLSAQEKDDIKDFGITWGLPHNFRPHFTLVYNSGKIDNRLKAIIEAIKAVSNGNPIKFKGQAIAIAKLGPAGNVKKILKTFPLGIQMEEIFHASVVSSPRPNI